MDLESYSIFQRVIFVLFLMGPAYLANTIAVLTGGKYPIDQGKLHSDGNRILGDGKTWSGLIGGTMGGMASGVLLYFYGIPIILTVYSILDPQAEWNSSFYYDLEKIEVDVSPWGESWDMFVVFFLLSFGALFGDMAASFYKRRQNLQRGDKFALLDMYDFIFMSLLLCFIFQRDWLLSWILDGWVPLFTILILTPFLHRGVNIIGYKIGVKNEPW
ncbi:MAG TPA: CDP-2,3-bis-(O-geranylgeranyl)-sn-glycerol synthase [Candidatus Poseidoniia archaeon]|nr:CDP-2,3-bis-(O-geranylgeranyl)-sn-glycerol synthase [Candidatus Poseidoniia archaeon]